MTKEPDLNDVVLSHLDALDAFADYQSRALHLTDPTADYIGDGVYVTHDGYHVWLRTMRGDVVHEIALEPSALKKLNEYVQRVREEAHG